MLPVISKIYQLGKWLWQKSFPNFAGDCKETLKTFNFIILLIYSEDSNVESFRMLPVQLVLITVMRRHIDFSGNLCHIFQLQGFFLIVNPKVLKKNILHYVDFKGSQKELFFSYSRHHLSTTFFTGQYNNWSTGTISVFSSWNESFLSHRFSRFCKFLTKRIWSQCRRENVNVCRDQQGRIIGDKFRTSVSSLMFN